ncbi:riboflavin synthase [Nakamurella leprariae]|uniref:Riboflavin synthase n=1 Tax=Nakamurella leprariae TaxID=2803911 RepID=A0A938YBU5_9ACTN|nr:riboflavin synthase [Nakamurella leprariae]MBM9467747.1 riboflavin synthase [Nakamurella leprariae]
MFTGIVEEQGEILALDLAPADAAADGSGPTARLTVRGPKVASDAGHGDSISVDGVCLTVIDRDTDRFTVDVMAETLRRSTLGGRKPGDPVNLERSVTAHTRLGGHIVQGHVDGVGTLVRRTPHPAYDEIEVEVDGGLGRYLAAKGAIAINGISLTVIDVVDQSPAQSAGAVTRFTVGIIPETRAATTLGRAEVGDPVNLEFDVVAKYVERLLATQGRDA